VNYELCKCGSESATLERQLFCGPALDPYSGIAIRDCGNKTSRGIDRENSVRRQPACQLASQRPRTTANVQHALTGRDAREIGEPGRQWL
jgi:hypothetical protein